MDETAYYKNLIENEQREMRKVEKEEDREWERKYFSRAENDPTFERLGKEIEESLEPEKTDGVWRWDEEKAKRAKPSFSMHDHS
jgi:hypothetical protein